MHHSREHDRNHSHAISVPAPSRLERPFPGVNGHAPAHPERPAGAPPAWPPRGGRGRDLALADLGPTLRHVARVVARYWWIGGLLAAAELLAFFMYLSTRQPMVSVEATLLAQSPLDRVLRNGAEPAGGDTERENIMRNHLALMTSRRFRDRLANSLTPMEARAVQTPFLQPGQKASPQELRSVLAGTIDVERERGRELFTIRVEHPDKATALMLADRFTSAYLQYARGDLRGANNEAQAALQKEADEMNRHVQALEDQRQEFQQRFDKITGGGGGEVIADRIKNLNNALSLVRVQRAQAEVEYQRAQSDLKASPTPFNNPTLAAYGNTAQLRADIDQRKADLAMLAAHYGPKHPKRLEADRALASLQDALQKNFQVALEELQSKVAIAASQEEELNEQLNRLLQESSEVDRVAAELATLDQKIAAGRDAHSDLLHRIAQAGVSAELPTDVMRVVDQAYVRQPMFPPRVVLGTVGVGGAMFLFLAGPLLWNATRRRVTSTLDLEAMLGTELLGVVPRLPWMWASQRPHIVRRGRRLEAVEAFIGTASQFELRSAGGCPRRIVVSSTLPGEGKSVVSSNLAAAFTRLGYRALLVDGDFRRPSQHRFHKCPNEAGLLRWIDEGCPGGGEASLEAIGVHALPGGTWLLPTGGTDPEPARHFLRPEVMALFERLSREFDVVIVDTSPAGLFPDAFFVTRFADAVALVVREGTASLDQVRKVIADFARTAAPVNGIVFNAIAGGVTHPSFGYRRVAARYARHYAPQTRPLPVRSQGGAPIPVEPITG